MSQRRSNRLLAASIITFLMLAVLGHWLGSVSLAQNVKLDEALDAPVLLSFAPDSPLSSVLAGAVKGYGYGFIAKDIESYRVTPPADVQSVSELVHIYSELYGLCAVTRSGLLVVWVADLDERGCSVFQPDDGLRDDSSDGAGVGTGDAAPVAETAEVAEQVPEPVRLASYGVRLRILEINEAKAAALGFNWDNGIFEIATALITGGYQAAAGYFPTAALDETIRFLERESVARRLDDLELMAVEGRTASFQSGGTINVQLVGSGAENIQRTFSYGIVLDVVPEMLDEAAELVGLELGLEMTTPVNASNPTLINLATRRVDTFLQVQCGQSVVVGSLVSSSHEGEGSGIPGLVRLPGAGYLVGSGSDAVSLSTVVLTLDLACPERFEASK